MLADKDLLSMQQARILTENAFEAQKRLAAFSQEKLDAIVECMATTVADRARDLAVLSHEETDYGRWEDKLAKNLFVCSEVPRHLRGMRCVGVIEEEPESGLMEIGVPLGVIVALCPVTSPVSTTIYKALLAVKSGNAIIFSPHPGALKSISTALDIMIAAAEAQGLPQGCLSYLNTVSKSGTAELMRHPATALIMISGVPGMFQAARSTGKPIIYGGAGHGPAFIERTADLRQAVQDIILSKTFDNGIAPSAEQSVVVETCISQEVKRIFQEHGAYFMSEVESLRLTDRFFHVNGRCKRSMVGLSADVLAKRADIPAPAGVKLLLAERKYVSEADPYSGGFFAPVLAYYVEDDWKDACEKCIELLLHERNAHTLAIHSNNKDVIRQFALKKPVGRMLVNTPAAYGGVGMSTNLFPAMTLGSGSAGYGITSDNVSSLNLIYRRKVGYGVRKAPAQTGAGLPVPPNRIDNTLAETDSARRLEALQRILTEAIEAMNGSSDR